MPWPWIGCIEIPRVPARQPIERIGDRQADRIPINACAIAVPTLGKILGEKRTVTILPSKGGQTQGNVMPQDEVLRMHLQIRSADEMAGTGQVAEV